MQKNTKKGFTLIELLVVVLIIGILSAVALPQYIKTVRKSRAVETIILIRSLSDAYKRYELATGNRPSSYDDLDIDIPSISREVWGGQAWEKWPGYQKIGEFLYTLTVLTLTQIIKR